MIDDALICFGWGSSVAVIDVGPTEVSELRRYRSHSLLHEQDWTHSHRLGDFQTSTASSAAPLSGSIAVYGCNVVRLNVTITNVLRARMSWNHRGNLLFITRIMEVRFWLSRIVE